MQMPDRHHLYKVKWGLPPTSLWKMRRGQVYWPLASGTVGTRFHDASGKGRSLRLWDVRDKCHIFRAKDTLKTQSWTKGLDWGLGRK